MTGSTEPVTGSSGQEDPRPDSKTPRRRSTDHAGDPGRPYVHGRRLPTTSRAEVSRRAAQIVRVATTNFAPLAAKRALRRPLPDDAYAHPLRLTFEELGATFMKFGQLIGSSPGVFGDAVAEEFRSCLDTGPAVPVERVVEAIEDDLGRPIEELFAHFDPEPVGRASIAVVHRATLHDGTDVAVKVLRPGIERRVAVDLDLFEPLLELVSRQTGEYTAGQLLSVFGGFRAQIGEELDLRNERRAIDNYEHLLTLVDLPLVSVPATYPEHSGRGVLTMEFIEGVPVDDLARVAEYGYDPRPVVQQVVQGFLLTAIRWGAFHGDVHAGNLLLRPDGRIGVIDWGIVGRLDPESHLFFRRMIEAALGDDTAWEDIGKYAQVAYGPVLAEGLGMGPEDIAQFIRVMIEPLLRAPFGEVSLATMLSLPQQRLAEARGATEGDRTMRDVIKRFREQRRMRALADEHGFYDSPYDRSMMTLTKAIMYFERYGKMFLADVGLFEDEAFFRKVLAEPHTAGEALGTAP